jgi:hypothetical protein
MIYTITKAKALPENTVRTWADGNKYKKVGKKWIKIAETKTTEEQIEAKKESAQSYFEYSMASSLGAIVDDVLQSRGIFSFEGLVKDIKNNDASQAHRIYKDVVDRVRRANATPGEKQSVLDMFGRSLLKLKNTYSTRPKTKLKTKVISKKGNVYYDYKEGKHSTELPVVKPSILSAAKKRVGGWDITGELSTEHVRRMIKNKNAKVLKGKPKSGKKWYLPKKAKDMELKYNGDGLTIMVRQKGKKEGSKTYYSAVVQFKIPYAYAKAFLLNQISSVRTRNNFIFRMEHSAGYRKFLDKAGDYGNEKEVA